MNFENPQYLSEQQKNPLSHGEQIELGGLRAAADFRQRLDEAKKEFGI